MSNILKSNKKKNVISNEGDAMFKLIGCVILSCYSASLQHFAPVADRRGTFD